MKKQYDYDIDDLEEYCQVLSVGISKICGLTHIEFYNISDDLRFIHALDILMQLDDYSYDDKGFIITEAGVCF